MNILLTGGAGYIGSHTALALLDVGHKIVLLDNFCNSDKDVIAQLEKISLTKIPCIEGDVCDTELVKSVIDRHQIDSVIHFAGLKAVGKSKSEPLAYYLNNVAGTLSLLQAMKACNVKSLVFSSSATVYGEPQYLPYDEIHPLNPINPYGRSKLQIEQILSDLAHSDPGWKIIALRYFNPVGAHDSGLIGENPNDIPNNLVPYIAQVAEGRLEWLNIYGGDYDTPDGTGVRDYVHVMDLAEGHIAALNYLSKHAGYETFNLGTGHGVSVLDLLVKFQEASGVSINYKIVGRREGDLSVCFANPSKAGRLLKWSAKRTVDDMCRSAWNWQSHLSETRK